MTNMSKPAMFTALFCVTVLLFTGIVAAEPVLLRADSGKNVTEMNATLHFFDLGVGKAVKLTAPSQNWKVQAVLIPGTDGWNETQTQLPAARTIALEIRDSNFNLLYHWSDIQLEYFTFPAGLGVARIEVPSVAVSGDFYVVLYERGAVMTFAELDNVKDQSFIFDRSTGNLYRGVLPVGDNKTIPVNWVIWAVGE
ncbi:hypothetical protein [Methanothrix sp.]|uniref:hypothetical protein n=1 Tax=Methanothrix sp. TaxID=90426 RepID=UPI002CF6384E|nr:hypothetical protein [Methanothrix sp.]HOK57543.1 hypothetical protein [Methanothrix sp.]HOL42919.1 hypothetical protein [Methanothrix sp.]HPO87828.1 hypothetical protein [Methanothrix sp.]